MNNIFFTSDTHFGHKNIVRACSDWKDKEKSTRDFSSIQEHDDFLINSINKKVKSTDTLYHLGDFGLGFRWKERFKEIRDRINCTTIVLLLGNHDHMIEHSISKLFPDTHEEYIQKAFKWTGYMKFSKICGRYICMSHYAMKTWPWQNQNSINLYGHSHGNLPEDINTLSLDVGMDTKLYGHELYTPYNIEEIFNIMDIYKTRTKIDHH